MSENLIKCPICKESTNLYNKFKDVNYYKCDHCLTIFQNPIPTLKDLNKYANHEYSGGLYNQYVHASNLKLAMFRERVRNILQSYTLNKSTNKKVKLLDLGCSCGYFIEACLEQGIDAYGVEFSEVAINASPKSVRSRIIHGDVNTLNELSNTTYDIITAFDILEHTLDPLAFISNIKKHLSNKGLLVITTPDTGHFLCSLMGKRWPMLQPYQHTFLFSNRGLKIVLNQAGFESLNFSPAKKHITLDYIMGQIKIFLPGLNKFYLSVSPIIPNVFRNQPISVNISETMVFAKPLPY